MKSKAKATINSSRAITSSQKLKLIPLDTVNNISNPIIPYRIPAQFPPYLLVDEVYKTYFLEEFIDFFVNKGIEIVNYLRDYENPDMSLIVFPFGNVYPNKKPVIYEDIRGLENTPVTIGVLLNSKELNDIIKGREKYPNTYNSPHFWWSLNKELDKVDKIIKDIESTVKYRIDRYIQESSKLQEYGESSCTYEVCVSFQLMDYLVINNMSCNNNLSCNKNMLIGKACIRPFIKISKRMNEDNEDKGNYWNESDYWDESD